jgi:UDP-N-acetylglucosamine acyltransferase
MATIHPSAVINSGAQIDTDVEIGPYCVVGEHVVIGSGTRLHPHTVVGGRTTLGQNCELFPFACIGMKTQDLKWRPENQTYIEIGDGTVLREFTTIHTGTKDGEVTRVGAGCLIMAYCHVAHGCSVGNRVIMSNGAQLAGDVIIEDDAIIAGMTGIHQFCRIGTMAMIGGACKIRQDCPPYMIVDGVPPLSVGPNVVGMQRHGVSAETRTAIKEAYRLLYREGLNRSQALERIQLEVTDCPEVRHLLAFVKASERGILERSCARLWAARRF